METSDNAAEKSILLKIAEKLSAAQQELDELAVQLALGKAEAVEAFEKIKKEFSLRLAELSQILESTAENEDLSSLKAKIAELKGQLVSGKADTKGLFKAQRQKLLVALKALEEAIKEKFIRHPRVSEIINEMEKFKLTLEILRLRFVLKKFEIKDGFRSGMKEAAFEITNLFHRTERKIKNAKQSCTDFGDEIQEAYRYIKKAVKKI